MDFDNELRGLAAFMANHLTPPAGHPTPAFERWELPPEVHIFRHRAEQMFAFSGLDEGAIEGMELHKQLPADTYAQLEKVALYLSLTKKLR